MLTFIQLDIKEWIWIKICRFSLMKKKWNVSCKLGAILSLLHYVKSTMSFLSLIPLSFLLAGPVPYSSYDGAWLRSHLWDRVILLWLRECPSFVCKDRGHIPSVLRTAVVPAPLWLWYAGREVCVDCSWKPQGRKSTSKSNPNSKLKSNLQGFDGQMFMMLALRPSRLMAPDCFPTYFENYHVKLLLKPEYFG